jgi:hypothetical protein
MTTDKAREATRSEYWRAKIEAQGRSGLSVHRFCQQQGLNEPSFYAWRKRVRREEPPRFALVEPLVTASVATVPVELLLASGERLRIGAGADASTIRAVIQALRA